MVRSRTPTAYNAYLSLLETSSRECIEDAIVSRLTDALRKKTSGSIPVKLSEVAEQFLIEPRPTVVVGPSGGSIEFDPTLDRFLITLSGQPQRSGSRGLTSYRDIGPAKRLRFTYAHEVAHRFFFVHNGTLWSRAVREVLKNFAAPERIKMLRSLTRVEEGICNNIAARVLVPDDHWIEKVAPALISELCSNREQFVDVLDELSDTYAVSKECLLVRFRRDVDRSHVEIPFPFALLVIEHSGVGNSTAITSPKLKVRVPIFPRSVFGNRVKRSYPGMDLVDLGSNADSIVQELARTKKDAGAVKMPIQLRHLEKGRPDADLTVHLKGWWRKLNGTSGAAGDRLMVWGMLNTNGEG